MLSAMKSFTCFGLVLIGLLMAGCASTPTVVDRGPIKAHTFSFVDPGKKITPGFADNRKEMHTMIQSAITKSMMRRGVQPVESGGDVTVAYLVIIGDNASTTEINDYFGHGRDDASGLSEKAHKAGAINSKNPNPYKAGALVIDIIDGASHELLKRNYAVRPILTKATTALRQERINEAVEETLRNLKIKRR